MSLQITGAIAQSKQIEMNQLNCKQAKEISSDSYEALAQMTNKSVKAYAFLRTEWRAEKCFAVMDTPTGPASCMAHEIYVTPKGVKFLFLTPLGGGSVFCFQVNAEAVSSNVV